MMLGFWRSKFFIPELFTFTCLGLDENITTILLDVHKL